MRTCSECQHDSGTLPTTLRPLPWVSTKNNKMTILSINATVALVCYAQQSISDPNPDVTARYDDVITSHNNIIDEADQNALIVPCIEGSRDPGPSRCGEGGRGEDSGPHRAARRPEAEAGRERREEQRWVDLLEAAESSTALSGGRGGWGDCCG